MNQLQLGDTGTQLVATIVEQDPADECGTIPVDVSAATGLRFDFLRPDKTTFERIAVLNTTGVDGKIRYTTVTGDIDQAGVWEVQAKATIGGWSGRSDRHRFKVAANIA